MAVTGSGDADPDGNANMGQLSRQSSVLSDLDESQSMLDIVHSSTQVSDVPAASAPRPTANGAGDDNDEEGAPAMDVDKLEAHATTSNTVGTREAQSAAPAPHPASYAARVAARQAALKERVAFSQPGLDGSKPVKHSFVPLYSIPQTGVQVNAMALPPCASHLYTAGSDGFIRRYAVFPSLRPIAGKALQPILRGYWENPSIAALEALSLGDVSKARFGPASVATAAGNTVPVHSLAVSSSELYALAGSAEGVINLFGVRLDEGQVRASLGLSHASAQGKAHTRGKPVSALELHEQDATLLSGGWDAQILQWDLNTGRGVREFVGHQNPVHNIQYRPRDLPPIRRMRPPEAPAVKDMGVNAARGSITTAAAEPTSSETSNEAEKTGGEGVPTDRQGKTDEEGTENSYDPLFDDDANTTAAPAEAGGVRAEGLEQVAMSETGKNKELGSTGDAELPSLALPSESMTVADAQLPGPIEPNSTTEEQRAPPSALPVPPALKPASRPAIPSFTEAPLPDDEDDKTAPAQRSSRKPRDEGSLPDLSNDIFLSTSTDGECMVWDRRQARRHVRRLDVPKGTPPWSVSSAWAADGMSVYVGRRNSSIDIYDLRTCTTRTITLSSSTGPVRALQPMRDQRHVLVSSADTVRLYDLDGQTDGVPAIIGGVGAGATCLLMDPMGKYLFAASGGRGWLENGREEVGVLRIDSVAQAE